MEVNEIFKALNFWGPGAVICGLMIFALYKLATFTISRFGDKFIASQVALAESAAKQAQSMEGLRDSIQGFVLRDNSEHREMLVLLKYMAQGHQETSGLVKRMKDCPHLSGREYEDFK